MNVVFDINQTTPAYCLRFSQNNIGRSHLYRFFAKRSAISRLLYFTCIWAFETKHLLEPCDCPRRITECPLDKLISPILMSITAVGNFFSEKANYHKIHMPDSMVNPCIRVWKCRCLVSKSELRKIKLLSSSSYVINIFSQCKDVSSFRSLNIYMLIDLRNSTDALFSFQRRYLSTNEHSEHKMQALFRYSDL